MKGFDFAKQHLGQHNKDDILIIHEPAPLPGPVKDHTTPSENGDVPSPKAKIPSKNVRHRGRFLSVFLYCSLSQSMFPFSVCQFPVSEELMVSIPWVYSPGDWQLLVQSQQTQGLPVRSSGLPEEGGQMLWWFPLTIIILPSSSVYSGVIILGPLEMIPEVMYRECMTHNTRSVSIVALPLLLC